MHLLRPDVTISLVLGNEQIELTRWLTKSNLRHLTKPKVALHPSNDNKNTRGSNHALL